MHSFTHPVSQIKGAAHLRNMVCRLSEFSHTMCNGIQIVRIFTHFIANPANLPSQRCYTTLCDGMYVGFQNFKILYCLYIGMYLVRTSTATLLTQPTCASVRGDVGCQNFYMLHRLCDGT